MSLPLAWPGLAAGAVLVFLYSFLSFGLPLLLGGEKLRHAGGRDLHPTAYELRLPEASALILVQLGVTLAAHARCTCGWAGAGVGGGGGP